MNTILKSTLKYNYVAKYLHRSMFFKSTNWKIVKLTFASSTDTFYMSLAILDDNFDYFKKKNNLNVIDENKNCIKISCVTKNIFETLLNIIATG